MAVHFRWEVLPMLFSEELRRLRDGKGFTQEALAQKAGMSVGNVRSYEQGNRLPSFPTVVKLAKALGVSCEAFAGCEDVSEEQEPQKPAKRGRKK
jgi:transcriptional regulator with XRE-family HTH domain